MSEDKLSWEYPVLGLAVLTGQGGIVVAKVQRDEATRLWRPAIVGGLATPEFTQDLGARLWVEANLNGRGPKPLIA